MTSATYDSRTDLYTLTLTSSEMLLINELISHVRLGMNDKFSAAAYSIIDSISSISGPINFEDFDASKVELNVSISDDDDMDVIVNVPFDECTIETDLVKYPNIGSITSTQAYPANYVIAVQWVGRKVSVIKEVDVLNGINVLVYKLEDAQFEAEVKSQFSSVRFVLDPMPLYPPDVNSARLNVVINTIGVVTDIFFG